MSDSFLSQLSTTFEAYYPVSDKVIRAVFENCTIRHLLSHQAGFPNPVPISWIHPATEDASFDEHTFITRPSINTRLRNPGPA